jgi:cellulose synthase/poly-beta-1,6-N-acetylglucosamine synthase-like glycosyltransferase
MTTITVMIPTFRRPASFLRAARSILAQTGLNQPLELVAVDNSPEGSAAAAFETLRAQATIPLHLIHEPRPGVANARNAGMTRVTGSLVAFLDDDEEAPEGWLAALVAVHRDTVADAVFGPVHARLPEGSGPHQKYVEALYTRAGPSVSGESPRYYGIGNALLVRASLLATDAPFDTVSNEKGGEDDILFSAAQAAGKRFAWAAEAAVIEHVPPERASLPHALKRAFAYGQGPCEAAFAATPPQWATIARHMLTGGVQGLTCGLAAGMAFLVRAPQRYWLLDKAVRGAGKVFWWSPQHFYGEALARATAANAQKA